MKKKVFAIVAVIALVAVLGVCLVACNADDYKKRLEKEGYTVIVNEDDSVAVKAFELRLSAAGYEGGIEFIVVATKGSESVTITKFDKLKDAKKYVDAFNEDESIKRTDKWVFVGTEQGIKDAK